ncbi:MAG: hypothetical protein GXP62_13445 [Oligoflexia bacterium]|nr:hypothetical protein [Oligoflexia bacterium]
MAPMFDGGVFVLSLDFELVWGSRDLYADIEPLAKMARLTRDRIFQELLGMLDDNGIIATWATIGHLFLDHASAVDGVLHPDIVPPDHGPQRGAWFDGVPEGSEAEHPEFYGRSLVLQLRDAGQEIGSHSFSHPVFGGPGSSWECAETEVSRCVAEAEKLDIKLESFVFPRNIPGQLDVLARHGFTCWRGSELTGYGRWPLPSTLMRGAHLAQVALASCPPTVVPWRDPSGLWCIPASASLLSMDGARRLIPVARRVKRCVRGLDRAVSTGQIFHLYLHPINLASSPRRMLDGLAQILMHAVRLRDAGRLEILPMAQVAARAEALVRGEGPGS